MEIEELTIVKTNQYNFQESAVYSPINLKNLVHDFVESKKCMKREIFIVFTDNRDSGSKIKYRVVQMIEDNENPEVFSVPEKIADYLYKREGYEEIARCEKIKAQFLALYYQELNMSMKKKYEIMLEEGKKYSRKQEQMNYKKEILRRMGTCKKLFVDEHMEGFDFREIDLCNAIFLNCILENANFSHVNLDHAAFINCNLTNAIFYKANLNNTMRYTCSMERIDKFENYE